MPITGVTKDFDAATMTVTADFAVPLASLWDAYADPRLIEKFWGPPGWPATFVRHDVAVGGRSHYTMRGPEGEESSGYWEFLTVAAPHSFEVVDGFATGEDGTPNTEMPHMRMVFDFTEIDGGSRLVTTTTFGSREELEQLIGMGMEEGMSSAMGQIDQVLADAAAAGTQAQILSDTQVRVSRVLDATVDEVWRAHHDPDLMKQWLLGPDGWTMPVCEIASAVGDAYRNEWAPLAQDGADAPAGFGFEGELVEQAVPYREVTTERMIGMEGPGTMNELTVTPRAQGGTLLSLLITYPSVELRDMVLGTGMTDGMEISYARLEQILAAG